MRIRGIKVAPLKKSKVFEFTDTESCVARIVGGKADWSNSPIREDEDRVVFLYNKWGAVDKLPMNRSIVKNGNIIYGTFIICELAENSTLKSLTDDEIERYMKLYEHPEIFELNDNNERVERFFD